MSKMDEVLERADQVTALSKNWPLILNTNGQFDAAEIVASLLKSNAELKNSVTQLRGERDYLSDSADAALASLDQAGYPTDTYAGIAAGIDALDSELRDTDKSQLEHRIAEEVVRNADLAADLVKARNVIEQVRAMHKPIKNSCSALYPDPACSCGSGPWKDCPTARLVYAEEEL